jgi:hypothetical protein
MATLVGLWDFEDRASCFATHRFFFFLSVGNIVFSFLSGACVWGRRVPHRYTPLSVVYVLLLSLCLSVALI